MDLVRFGRGIRALRMRRRWRQVDLARVARLGRGKVARVELGRFDGLPVRDLERMAQALGARADLRLSWNGEGLDRLLDGAHASLVDLVVVILQGSGWEVAVEVTFWIRGERGSIDVLAWHPPTGFVLVVEVKSIVPDHQAMLASLDRKARLAREIARDRGWAGAGVGKLLVIGDTRTSRRRIEALAETHRIAFPHRARAIRRWLARPDVTVPLAGLWFLSDPRRVSTRHRATGR